MIEKTVTDDSSGLKKATVKMTTPVIEVEVLKGSESSLNGEIKTRLLDAVSQLIDKNLT
tara:strand:+ start:210 stop:386 length:177 start_codon:yes stop_codon:yes gene_type:complete